LALEFASPNVAEQHKQRHTIFAERLLRVTFRLSTEVVISMACFGKADHKITVTAKARFGNRNHLSEMATRTKPLARRTLPERGAASGGS